MRRNVFALQAAVKMMHAGNAALQARHFAAPRDATVLLVLSSFCSSTCFLPPSPPPSRDVLATAVP
jgi:hypothetical protein